MTSVKAQAKCSLVVCSIICALSINFIPLCFSQNLETDPEVLVVNAVAALAKSMDYYKGLEQKSAVHSEELLGLRVATDSLLWVVEECNKSSQMFVPLKILEQMKLLCAKLSVLLPRLLNIHQPKNLTSQYKRFLVRQFKLFRPFRSINIDNEERKQIPTMAPQGAPQLSLVQSCIGDLSVQNDTCYIPDECWKVLQPRAFPGYLVTHQAMLLSLTLMTGCQDVVNKRWQDAGVTVDELADGICFTLYPRVSSFHQSEFLPDEEEELFLDSFFACSLLGFEDYLHVVHMRIADVLETQLSSGCFGFVRTEKGEECIPRMTSSGVGELALYIRWLLHEKGYVTVFGKQPFKRTSWTIPIRLVLLIVASVLVLVFFRRIQRGIQSVLGRLLWSH